MTPHTIKEQGMNVAEKGQMQRRELQARKEAFIRVLDMWTANVHEMMVDDYTIKGLKQLLTLRKVKYKLQKGKLIKQEVMRPLARDLAKNLEGMLIDSVAEMSFAWDRQDRKDFLEGAQTVVDYFNLLAACEHYARSWNGFAS